MFKFEVMSFLRWPGQEMDSAKVGMMNVADCVGAVGCPLEMRGMWSGQRGCGKKEGEEVVLKRD